MLIFGFLLAAAAAQATPPAAPRKEYGACLAAFTKDAEKQKLDPAAYRDAAKAACATKEATFRSAWIAYELAMKQKRADAEKFAAEQIDEYLDNTAENYKLLTAGAPPKE